MPNFVFILTRHVNSEKTNHYWNTSVKLLRTFYPFRQIVIIDDNSNQEYVKSFHEYKNLTIISSEFPQRGELLPFIYYLRHPEWGPAAVIIHDSTFIHKHVTFEKFNMPVLPLWNFQYDKENLSNLHRIASALKNNARIHSMFGTNDMTYQQINQLGIHSRKSKFICCFGAQLFIQYRLLAHIEAKYQLSNLVHVIHCRIDRCAFERILGALITLEYPGLIKFPSLLGNIQLSGDWGYTFEDYQRDFYQHKKLPRNIIKVWTGR
jgi:hypothetical protein